MYFDKNLLSKYDFWLQYNNFMGPMSEKSRVHTPQKI